MPEIFKDFKAKSGAILTKNPDVHSGEDGYDHCLLSIEGGSLRRPYSDERPPQY